MGAEGKGTGMTRDRRSSCRAAMCVVAMFLFASTGLSAQAGSGTPAPPAASPSTSQPTQNVEASMATKAHDDSFVIGNDDVLAINVWKEPDVSRSIPVRSDGKISLPLVGEVQATGRTPLKLEQDIAARLKNYIAEPEVTVIVQQINSQKFNILGMVSRPGSFVISNSATVLDAIALAGGFRDFAKQKSIYVLRQNADGTQTRLPFNYKEVVKGRNPAQNVKLQPRDTIVVP
jgi:polysaccharide export outer membrane protein